MKNKNAARPLVPAFSAVLMACLLVLSACSGEDPPTPDAGPGPESMAGTISLSIDFGGGRTKQFDELPFSEGMTVKDALEQLAGKGVEIRYRGQGATLFVHEMDSVSNGQDGKYWIYFVNEEKAPIGAGVQQLAAGDVVLWKFTDEVKLEP